MLQNRHQQSHRILTVTLALLLAVSCGSQGMNGEAPEEELRILPGHFAEESVTTPYIAVEALIGENEFFVSSKAKTASFTPAVTGRTGPTWLH